MTSFITHKKLFVYLLIVGLIANILFAEAKGKRKKDKKPPGSVDGITSTSKPDGASTTTGKPEASASTGKPGGTTTTGKPGGTSTTPSSNSTNKPGSTSSPSKDDSTTTKNPKSKEDQDKEKLEQMMKLQSEEKDLLKQIDEKMQAWTEWIEKHHSKTMNKHHLFDIHHQYCDRMVEIYRLTPRQKRFGTLLRRSQTIKATGLHTITV